MDGFDGVAREEGWISSFDGVGLRVGRCLCSGGGVCALGGGLISALVSKRAGDVGCTLGAFRSDPNSSGVGSGPLSRPYSRLSTWGVGGVVWASRMLGVTSVGFVFVVHGDAECLM